MYKMCGAANKCVRGALGSVGGEVSIVQIYHPDAWRGRGGWGCTVQYRTSIVRIYVDVLSHQDGRRIGGNLEQVQSMVESGVYRMCRGSNKCVKAVLEGGGVRLNTA